MDKFYLELTKQLRQYQDETAWLNVETIQQMVEAARIWRGIAGFVFLRIGGV